MLLRSIVRAAAGRFAAPFACAILLACAAPAARVQVTQARLEPNRVVLTDGAVLPLVTWAPATGTPRAAIVALHGLSDHGTTYARAAEHLAANGFAVYAYDQRGFGGTAQRGRWPGGDVLARDVLQVAALVRARHPGVPLYVLGESMGGAVLLRALALEPSGWLNGAVLLAPAVWSRGEMPWYQRFALGTLSHTFRGMRFSRPRGRAPTDDPETLRSLREDPLVIHKTRVDVLAGVSDLMDEVTEAPRRFAVPVLILYGAEDKVIPARAFCSWVASLDASAPWRLVLYPRGWHMLLRDLDARTAGDDVTAWLIDAGGALPSGLETQKPRDASACLAAVRALARAAPVSAKLEPPAPY
ncbi:MAG TPA: alpha/beta hydrolase [Gammaproteobacteria bacterium]|nr:alpha/beta hydrolase [Gammaproteobacteria bacterium]